MKKLVFSAIAIALLAISCGPSAKEIEDKRIADSIMVADSIALVLADTICVDSVVIEVVE